MSEPITSGPSPLTRGNPGQTAATAQTLGSIPAHAGQPWPAARRATWAGVHPRSRGPTPTSLSARPTWAGPSPLTRANPQATDESGRVLGSIPAHAGQPANVLAGDRHGRVHPRSRGPTTSLPIWPCRQAGPSPLTRANLVHATRQVGHEGSIPAHAGQPCLSHQSRWRRRVHPRSRGPTFGSLKAALSKVGPSPLTRANPCTRPASLPSTGSIPAHAGQPLKAKSLSLNEFLMSTVGRPRAYPQSRQQYAI